MLDKSLNSKLGPRLDKMVEELGIHPVVAYIYAGRFGVRTFEAVRWLLWRWFFQSLFTLIAAAWTIYEFLLKP